MKPILKAGIVALGMLVSAVIPNKSTAQVSFSVSFQTFYDELSPYGTWIYYPQYGYVWQPANTYYGFHPYRSGGHWVWSEEYGWLWYSDYEWGWAPFHYGRWFYDSYYGWLWVPDYEWAPAWVVWRSGGGYYGWAPMSPGISIGLYFGGYYVPNNYWCFTPYRYINSPYVSRYYINVQQNTTIINNTTVINRYTRTNNVFVTGPARTQAESYIGSRIQPVSIRESGKPGRMRERKNELTLYRPQIQRERTGKVAPEKFERYNWGDKNDPAEKRNNITNERRDRVDKEIRRKEDNAPADKENRSIRQDNNRAREIKPQSDRQRKSNPSIERRNAPNPRISDNNRKQMERNNWNYQRVMERNMQQKRQPDVQNRRSPVRETPQMKESRGRQQPSNKSNEKGRGKKKGKE
jgi:hypothetical protein